MIEECRYCGDAQETGEPMEFAGVPIKECPKHPLNPQMTILPTMQTLTLDLPPMTEGQDAWLLGNTQKMFYKVDAEGNLTTLEK